MKTLLLFLSITIAHCATSQNRVVKDNLACLYGIKNPEGAWVVKPKYILLTGYTYGYFLIQEGPNYGLLDQDGSELLPCEYSKIAPLNYKWHPHGLGKPVNQHSPGRIPLLFQVEKNNQRALVDDKGKTLIPLRTQYFKTDNQKHVIISEYRKPNHFTSYIDLDGNYLFKDLPGAIQPFRSNEIALIGLRTPGSNGTVEGNVRVINKKGEYVSPRQFNRALVCSKGTVVFEDSLGHLGTMDATGKILIEPKYKLVFKTYSRENILPCLYSAQHTFIIKNDEGKLGLMNGLGKVVCTPEYDHLEKLHGQWKTAETEWRVRKNGKTGMLSKSARESIPCNYDTLIPFKLDYNRNTSLDGFVVMNSRKYGLIGMNGDTIIPIEYPFFERASTTRSALFGNLDQLSEIRLVDNSLQTSQIQGIGEFDNFSVFKGAKDHYFVLNENQKGKLKLIKTNRCMNLLWFQERRSSVVLFTTSGEQLDDENIHSVYQHSSCVHVQNSEGESYLINARTGKKITKPSTSAQFRLNSSNQNQIWSKGIVEPKSSWVILDTNGQRAGLENFDQPFNLRTKQTSVLQGGYWGIYGVQQEKWLVPANYTCIDILSETVFKTRLQSGQWELHSLDAKTTFGPFETMELLFSSTKQDINGSRTIEQATFLVSQNGKSFLINSLGEKITHPSEIKRIQIALAYGTYMWNNQKAFSRGFTIKHNESNFKVNALYSQLYELLNEDDRSYNYVSSEVDKRTCNCQSNRRTPPKNELSYVRSNAASVAVSHYVSPAQPWDVGYYEVRN